MICTIFRHICFAKWHTFCCILLTRLWELYAAAGLLECCNLPYSFHDQASKVILNKGMQDWVNISIVMQYHCALIGLFQKLLACSLKKARDSITFYWHFTILQNWVCNSVVMQFSIVLQQCAALNIVNNVWYVSHFSTTDMRPILLSEKHGQAEFSGILNLITHSD